ncbi:MAG TPA: M20/M25/M40 family metallo-hydrolase, partial [Verrucomicrobiae bacterium]
VRHARDGVRAVAWRRLQQLAQKIARQRHLRVQFKMMHSAAAVACAREFTQTLAQAVQKHQPRVLRLPSGAGHDAAVMAAITPVAMLFVRCRRGISHHPAESVRVADIAIALRVMTDFLVRQGRKHESA